MQSTIDNIFSVPEVKHTAAASEEDVFVMPATPCQIRFWLLHSIHPDNYALNMPIAWTCKGNFNPDVVVAALANLVQRHESLRTTFDVVDGKIAQVIHPSIEISLPVEDLHHLPPEEREQKAKEIIHRQARITMDMKEGPLLFARAIRMDADEHILLLTIHHSVCDGWSNGVLIRDFAAIYDGLIREVSTGLPDLPIQFGDYAVWLDEWRKGKELTEYLKYWRETLGGNFKPLPIRHDFAGDGDQQHGAIETLLLPAGLAQAARDFCAAQGITLYMLLLTVYSVMLHQLTGERDILIGTPCANRRQEMEHLIGPFSNPQVIRVRMEKENNLGAVLEYVRKWTLGAMMHQILPFEDLNEDEFFSRAENQISLQVYFIYQKAFMQVQHTPSLVIVPLRSVSPGTTFDLLLSIVERAEGPRLQLEYNPGLFSALSIQQILQRYIHVLEAILSNLESPVCETTEWTGGEQQLLPPSSSAADSGAAEPARNLPDSLRRNLDNGTLTSDKLRGDCAPPDSLELQIAEIWKIAMGLKCLGGRESFFDLGGRSLAAMRIVSRINRTYSLDFGLATLFSAPTVERMAELVRKRLSANVSSSIVAMQPRGSSEPLFIIHGAGGNIIRFYQLAMLVGTDHPVYGIQAQSLLAGKPALLRIEDQAAFYLDEIRKIQPKGPYYFLGYSFGGMVALEIAHQLQELGEQVALLGMLDSRQLNCIAMAQKDDDVLARIDRRIARFLGNVRSLSVKEMGAYLCDKLLTRTLRRIYGIAVAFGFRSVPSYMKSTNDISWIAAMNYRQRIWSGKITLFRTSVQPDPRLPMDLGWTSYARGGVEVYELPGDHDLIFREPNIQVMADQLRVCLQRSNCEQSDGAVVYRTEPVVCVK
ncbi:MAG: condensation domain-containing protein [Terracidiphilus sp.]